VVGTSYQLGNLASSASATIEAKLGERFPLPPVKGQSVYDYGKAMCIFAGAVFAYIVLITIIGPEYLGRRMDASADHDFESTVGGHDAVEHALHPREQGDVHDKANGEKRLDAKEVV
jgi:MFS transporter, SHS family, lactate transporter